MKIVIVSDTHGQHERLGVLSGDVLVHCGDFALGERGARRSLDQLDAWFAQQQFKLILCTGGNHDFAVEERVRRGRAPFRNARYLQDESVAFEGVLFHGAPWVPELRAWAHYRTEPELAQAWDRIPNDVDVLITHTPPRGVLDVNSSGKACGCVRLKRRLEAVHPKLHCFGHIHASAGVAEIAGTRYVNASMVNSRYELVHPPLTLTLAVGPGRSTFGPTSMSSA